MMFPALGANSMRPPQLKAVGLPKHSGLTVTT